MIKNDLIDLVRDQVGGVTYREVWDYVTFIVDEMASSLANGEPVKISNFGSFETYHKNARTGRNPKTLEETEISARNVVRFRASKNI